MDFQTIDIIIIGITIFLAIKGLVAGFSKELFNFLGLVGAIAVASRLNGVVADLIIEQNILPESAVEYQKAIGFVALFLALWIIFNIISSIVSNFGSDDEIGVISRILGYLIAFIKYASILSLIVFGLNNSDFFKEKLSKYTQESQLFKPMSQIGADILNKSYINIENNTTSVENNSTKDVNSTKDNNISKTD